MKAAQSLLLLLLLGSAFLPLAATRASAQVADSPIQVNGWTFLNYVWGSSTAPVEVGPGSQNVPLVITEQLYYANTATGVSATLELPNGWTSTTGGSNASSYLSGSVVSGQIETFTFYLNIANNVAVGEYTLPLTIAWGAVTPNVESVSLEQSQAIPINLLGKVTLAFVSPMNSINPGVTNTIPITMTNDGSGTASSLTVTVAAGGGASITTPPYKLDSLGVNASETFNVGTIIPSSLEGSSLTLTISVTYTDAYGTAIGPLTQTLGVFVQNPAALSPLTISVQPPSLAAGQTNDLSFTVLNSGLFPITDLGITFNAVSQQSTTTSTGAVVTSGATTVTLLSGSLFQATSLPTDTTTTPQVQIFIGDSVTGSIEVSLSLSYYQGNILKTETRTFGFIVTPDTSASFSPLGITVTPTTLLQGEYTNMTISILNTYKTTPIVAISDTPTISASGVTILGPEIFQQTSVAGGSSMVSRMEVYVPPTAPSAGQLSLALSYYVNNTLKTETRVIGILFRGDIDLQLTGVTITPTTFTPGSAGSITMTLTNLGATGASAVTASAALPKGFTAFGTTSSLIGDMAVDTPTTFSISMTVANGTAGGVHVIPVSLTYLDNLRTQTTKVVNINVTVAGGQGFATGTGTSSFTRTGSFTGSFTGTAAARGAFSTTQFEIDRYIPFPYFDILVGALCLAGGILAGRKIHRKAPGTGPA